MKMEKNAETFRYRCTKECGVFVKRNEAGLNNEKQKKKVIILSYQKA